MPISWGQIRTVFLGGGGGLDVRGVGIGAVSLPADCWPKCFFEVEKARDAVGIEARGLLVCLANAVILAMK